MAKMIVLSLMPFILILAISLPLWLSLILFTHSEYFPPMSCLDDDLLCTMFIQERIMERQYFIFVNCSIPIGLSAQTYRNEHASCDSEYFYRRIYLGRDRSCYLTINVDVDDRYEFRATTTRLSKFLNANQFICPIVTTHLWLRLTGGHERMANSLKSVDFVDSGPRLPYFAGQTQSLYYIYLVNFFGPKAQLGNLAKYARLDDYDKVKGIHILVVKGRKELKIPSDQELHLMDSSDIEFVIIRQCNMTYEFSHDYTLVNDIGLYLGLDRYSILRFTPLVSTLNFESSSSLIDYSAGINDMTLSLNERQLHIKTYNSDARLQIRFEMTSIWGSLSKFLSPLRRVTRTISDRLHLALYLNKYEQMNPGHTEQLINSMRGSIIIEVLGEFDCRTNIWCPIIKRSKNFRESLKDVYCYQGPRGPFRPVTKIPIGAAILDLNRLDCYPYTIPPFTHRFDRTLQPITMKSTEPEPRAPETRAPTISLKTTAKKTTATATATTSTTASTTQTPTKTATTTKTTAKTSTTTSTASISTTDANDGHVNRTTIYMMLGGSALITITFTLVLIGIIMMRNSWMSSTTMDLHLADGEITIRSSPLGNPSPQPLPSLSPGGGGQYPKSALTIKTMSAKGVNLRSSLAKSPQILDPKANQTKPLGTSMSKSADICSKIERSPSTLKSARSPLIRSNISNGIAPSQVILPSKRASSANLPKAPKLPKISRFSKSPKRTDSP